MTDGSFEYVAAWNGLSVSCGNWKGFPGCRAVVERVLPGEPRAPSGESVLHITMGGGYSTLRINLDVKTKNALCGASRSSSLSDKRVEVMADVRTDAAACQLRKLAFEIDSPPSTTI